MDADGLCEIGEQVYALYRRGPFERVLKTAIERALFRAYARHQRRLKRRPEEFRWHDLGHNIHGNRLYASASPRGASRPC